MLNRSAIIVRYQQPFVDWVNAVDSDDSDELDLAEANEEGTVYLIEAEDRDDFDAWIDLNFGALFEEEIAGWYTDPAVWPQDRTRQLFDQWFDIEFHSVVLDTGSSVLEDDET